MRPKRTTFQTTGCQDLSGSPACIVKSKAQDWRLSPLQDPIQDDHEIKALDNADFIHC